MGGVNMPHIPDPSACSNWPRSGTAGWRGEYDAHIIGYRVVKRCGIVWRRTPIKRVTLNLDFPACFKSGRTGLIYRPDMVVSSDQGSIPIFAQALSVIPGLDLRRDTWEIDYAMHDSGYELHGHFILQPTGVWLFTPLPRVEVDLLLWEGIKLGQGNATERTVIYDSLRLGGGFAWSRHKYCPV